MVEQSVYLSKAPGFFHELKFAARYGISIYYFAFLLISRMYMYTRRDKISTQRTILKAKKNANILIPSNCELYREKIYMYVYVGM